ncbi:N-(5'-phosphoribosyl)anthranilate isomerase [Gracilibacillus halophilus YIM-C55.5]|uniref:N-(5'-phosphoribosyl)anthranilate isomerase n=1 Tax=Gracilibacillus halophilus YIM-C55.5 TaxID=1308866 RepID=N4WTM3_9BACI|nr:phosphoribosylanthranilate isomerase [Gracilibacillus halophilus]ENH97700.1 N-(5'-phosphoribosyl)anthranilate isomerase [Gracilibacillus halophilus YIM-C55.5]
MVQVKICGLKHETAVRAAVDVGADFLGFVFAHSKRQVSVEQAKQLAQNVPSHVKKVGVFVNEELSSIQHAITEAGLDYVQLHGDESPAFCQQIGVPVIKAFQVISTEDVEQIGAYDCAYYLLDSPAGKYRGGNGETFDWTLTKQYDFLNKRVILAGGLRQDNVQEAIDEVQPTAVDVSSGVETDGEKDVEKIQAFINTVKKGE